MDLCGGFVEHHVLATGQSPGDGVYAAIRRITRARPISALFLASEYGTTGIP